MHDPALPPALLESSTSRRRRRQPEDFPVRMTRREASAYLKEVHGINRHEPNTLAKLAVQGRRPLFQKSGRWVLYRRDHLDVYATERLSEAHRSTAEHAAARNA